MRDNGRGTAEQWIKEGKNAVQWTKLSCRMFKPVFPIWMSLEPFRT